MINVVRRSILFSALERYGGLIFFLASTAILSRLLTPQEFGIYAVISAITGVIAASFRSLVVPITYFKSRRYQKKKSVAPLRLLCAYRYCLLLRFLSFVTSLHGSSQRKVSKLASPPQR